MSPDQPLDPIPVKGPTHGSPCDRAMPEAV